MSKGVAGGLDTEAESKSKARKQKRTLQKGQDGRDDVSKGKRPGDQRGTW